MASASINAWLRRFGTGLFFMWWAAVAAAHPMPESVVWIDTTPDGLTLTAQLPLNRLEFSFGKSLTDHPETVLQRHGDALAAYLLVHIGVRSNGKGWQALRPQLAVTGMPGSEELQAKFVLRAPANADPREPTLLYDVITHEVRTHRVQVFLRNDWKSGFVGETPLLVGELNHENKQLYIPLEEERLGAGFASLYENGIEHIAAGTDHLLFLLLLVLVAPLTAAGGRWRALRALPGTLKHTAFVITAFTIGHTVTLVLGSSGLVTVPAQLVEVAVALTIVAAAVHAWRPLFARAETWMALCFGMVHGLAFSSSLAGAGLTRWQHAQALLAFNLGIETMQLLALAAVLPPLLMLSTARLSWYAAIRRVLAGGAGTLACLWAAQRIRMVELAGPAWLGDGGSMPIMLTAMLWLVGLACFVFTQKHRRKC